MIRLNAAINKNVLISTYKIFTKTPKKVFVMKELYSSSSMTKKMKERYLPTLINLGLIEKVETIYIGSNNSKRRINGYRLKDYTNSEVSEQ